MHALGIIKEICSTLIETSTQSSSHSTTTTHLMMLQLLRAKLGSFSLYVQNWVQEAQHFPNFVKNFPNIYVSDFDSRGESGGEHDLQV